MSDIRHILACARKLVIKIGTTSLTTPQGDFDPGRLAMMAQAIDRRIHQGSEIVIVSSGAIAAGLHPLGLAQRPSDVPGKQAAAAVGQMALINAWSQAFCPYGRPVAQILLAPHDMSRRISHTNAHRTFDKLLSWGAIPIVNENDTVATNEIKFGDNDRLSALVAHLISADGLIILSDIDGLYTSDPRTGPAQLISRINHRHDLYHIHAGIGSRLGTGGMASKVSAALLAAQAGIPVLITAADQIQDALTTATAGTVFAPQSKELSARKFWVRYTADTTGTLHIDSGAAQAILTQHCSLLAAGITHVSGGFHRGDVVELCGPDHRIIARGIIAYDAGELSTLMSTKQRSPRPVIHVDDLVTF